MPDMDGLELIQEMQKKNNQIKFVVLSGYAEFSYAETAIRLGVKAYLLKAVSNDDLQDPDGGRLYSGAFRGEPDGQ